MFGERDFGGFQKVKIKSDPMIAAGRSLKIITALKLIEIAAYELDDLLRAVDRPLNELEFALAEVAHDDNFWLLIDAKYGEGELTTYRLDVPPGRRRGFVQGFADQSAYIYTVKHEWDPYVPFLTFEPEITIGLREITYPDVAPRLYKQTFAVGPDETGIQYMGIQINNIEPTRGSYGYAWGFYYDFYLVHYPNNVPRRTCLFESANDSHAAYGKVIDDLAMQIHFICHKGMDFDVPPEDIGFLINEINCIPSQLSLDDIKAHLLQTFTNEDPISLKIFPDDGILNAFEYLIDIYNIMPDDRVNVGLTFNINISQLRF